MRRQTCNNDDNNNNNNKKVKHTQHTYTNRGEWVRRKKELKKRHKGTETGLNAIIQGFCVL